tara:strand:+ start:190 stop:735 length:546 start_codon:yes stop_codon:yes gene_type:complete
VGNTNKVYELNIGFDAPDLLKSSLAKKSITQFFPKESRIIGSKFKTDKILSEKRFVFPLDYLKEVGEFTHLKKDSNFDETITAIKTNAINLSESEKERLDNVGESVKGVVEGTMPKRIKTESQYYKNGAIIGLGGGIVLGLYLNKSVWVFGALGIAIGGYISHHLHKTKSIITEPVNTQIV